MYKVCPALLYNGRLCRHYRKLRQLSHNTLRRLWLLLPTLTATKVSKDIVALFREGDLVDSVSDVASLQQVAGIFTGFSAIWEPFHMMEEPVHHIRAWGRKDTHILGTGHVLVNLTVLFIKSCDYFMIYKNIEEDDLNHLYLCDIYLSTADLNVFIIIFGGWNK